MLTEAQETSLTMSLSIVSNKIVERLRLAGENTLEMGLSKT